MKLTVELPKDPYQYNGLTLAYIGDAIYEVYVRQHLLMQGGSKVYLLHHQATGYVCAKAQAFILKEMMKQNLFNEREEEMIRRGRNAKSGSTPKNTDVIDYRLSTGFESLIGYLYLAKELERMEEIIKAGFTILERGEGQSWKRNG